MCPKHEIQNDTIIFQWVRTHNLKNIDIELPKNKIITITWVSGSWKSSLAFDTIYKEGQFRYIESLSSYLRQFFNLWSRPEIDYSSWLSPAIAIEQNKRVWNARSTVGTLTEIDDYLRLLFAKLWDIFCYKCWTQIKAQTTDQIVDDIKAKFLDDKIYLLEDMWTYSSVNDLIKFMRKNRKKVENGEWYVRYLVSFEYSKKWFDEWDFIEYFYLEDPKLKEEHFPLKIYWIYDRVTIQEKKLLRLKEDIIKILWKWKKFWVYPLSLEDTSWKKIKTDWDDEDMIKSLHWETWIKFKKDAKYSDIIRYTDKIFCANCNIIYPEFTTQHFSPNRQEWACSTCHGLWQTLQVDFDRVIDPFSDYKSAILPWRDSNLWQAILEKLSQKYSIDESLLWKDLPDWFRQVVRDWDWEVMKITIWWKLTSMYYKWIEDILTQQYQKWILTVDFQSMLNFRVCPECGWAKLKKESLNVFIWEETKDKHWLTVLKNRKNIFDLQNLEIRDLISFLRSYVKSSTKPKILLNRISNPLVDRAATITDLGLWYLSLYRPIDTLSWWEIQRLRLAKQLWNKLAWIIYVLDEPTIGLDEKEIKKIIESIKKLKEIWNTIIVVEHNEDFIRSSERIVEIGPWAWDFGWEVMFNWEYKDFIKSKTLTAKYITWKKEVLANFTHKPTQRVVQIKKAHKYNLKNIDVNFNLGGFTIITWPSWAWKTTLMYHILFRFLNEKEKYIQSQIRINLLKKWYSWTEIIQAPIIRSQEYEHFENVALQQFYQELWVETIKWFEHISNVIYVDQTGIWKTPRSCPATFIGVFDDMRKIFAWTADSKMIWFTSWHFSFNSGRWACPECNWYWYKKVELQFLPDTYVHCELCHGTRYKPEILWVYWRGKNISQVLDMYVEDALELFSEIGFIRQQLQLMVDIWLWYLKLGQPAHTLSGGESQRLKLVKHLLKSYKWHTVYFLDEPTVGLHFADIEKLLAVIAKFLDKWDTVLMIEHERNLLKYADKIIRLDEWALVK